MASKTINTILNLKDNFSKTLDKTNNNTKKFQRQLKHAQNAVKSMKNSVTDSFKSIVKGAVALGSAYVGINAVKNFANESVDAAKAQIEAETKLQAVLKNTKGITDKQIQGLKAYASAQQNIGVIGDEVQLAGIQQIGTFQLQADTIKTLIPGMNDLLAQQKGLNASQQDAVGIGNLIGKVMNGQAGALSRVGISFTKAQEKALKNGNEMQRAAMLAEVLKQNVGGVNKAIAETDQGKIQQMTNAWGDMKEEIGKKILPLQSKFAAEISKTIPSIQKFGVNAMEKIGHGVDWLSEKMGKLSPYIEKVNKAVSFLKDNADLILPSISGLVSAFVAFNIISKTILLFNTLKKAFAATTIKAWLLNTALLSNPVVWIAIGIGVLVAALVVAYKKSDTFRNSVNQLFNKIKEFGVTLLNNLVPALQQMYNWFKVNILPVIQQVVAYFTANVLPVITLLANTLWSVLVTAFTGLMQILSSLWNNVLVPLFQFFKTVILPILTGLGAVVLWVWQNVFAPLISFLLTVLQPAFTVVFSVISSIVSGVFENIGGVIKGITNIFRGLIDFIVGVFTGDWSRAWEGIKSIFKGIWGGLVAIAKAPINLIISGINGLIRGFNRIGSIKLPGFLGGGSIGINVPEIPKFALGTQYFKGGYAQINERGGEIVNLPNGSKVIPADKSNKMLSGGNQITVQINVQGNMIGNRQFADEMARIIVSNIEKTVINYGGAY